MCCTRGNTQPRNRGFGVKTLGTDGGSGGASSADTRAVGTKGDTARLDPDPASILA